MGSPRETSSRRRAAEDTVSLENIGENTVFLHGIFTMRSEKEERRRQLIRDTYLQDPRLCPLKDLTDPSASTPSSCFVYYTFVVGGGDKSTPTQHQDDSPLTLAPSTEEEIRMGD